MPRHAQTDELLLRDFRPRPRLRVPIQLPLALVGCGSVRYRMKFGTRTTWKGMISVARRIPKSGPRPRNGMTANAYAAIDELTSWPAVHRMAILSELAKNVPNVTSFGNAFHMFA